MKYKFLNKNQWGIVIITAIWALLMIILFSSCSSEKRCIKARNKAVELGCLSLDSSVKYVERIIKGDSVRVPILIFVPDSSADSLIRVDTCYTKERIRTVLKNAVIKPIDTTTKNGTRVLFSMTKGAPSLEIYEPDRRDTVKIINNQPVSIEQKGKRPWWDRLWIGIVVGIWAVMLPYMIFKPKT